MCMQITAICILSLQTEFSPRTHSWRLFKTAHIVMLMSCQLHNSFLKKKKAHFSGDQCTFGRSSVLFNSQDDQSLGSTKKP